MFRRVGSWISSHCFGGPRARCGWPGNLLYSAPSKRVSTLALPSSRPGSTAWGLDGLMISPPTMNQSGRIGRAAMTAKRILFRLEGVSSVTRKTLAQPGVVSYGWW
jgi:hypothetical protein